MKNEWWDISVFQEWVIIDKLAEIILYYVDGCIVEIGLGGSTVMLAKHAKNFGIKHYAVDINPLKIERTLGKIAQYGYEHEKLIIYNGLSVDFMKTFDDVPALVLIDGCHDSEVVALESTFFIEKLPPGGVMFLHDTFLCKGWVDRFSYEEPYDTYKVRHALERSEDVWCMTFPYTARAAGLTLVLKRPDYEYGITEIKEIVK